MKNETALGGFPPTEEQVLIKDCYLKGDNIMVDAGAGSSKTSSGIYITEQDERSVLYLAYNKAIAQEARTRFPKNVFIKTFHALAYAFVGYKYKEKLHRPSGQYVNVAMTISEIQKYYNIQAIEGCNALRISSLIKDTLTRFEYSADDKISNKHISQSKLDEFQRLSKLEKSLDFKKLKEITVAYSTRLWEDRINLQSQVMCSHDTYLKLFQLSGPKLKYDCIIGDEFQDVNPVVADIILNQDCQKVLIGDPNQSIYGWRGARNFLTDNDGYTTLLLSKSFRYGPAIADLAMTVINYKRKLEGFDQKDSVIGTVDTSKPYTKIFRTNACLLVEAVELISEGVAVWFDINHKDFVNKIYNVLSLKHGEMNKVKHKDIILFESYDELLAEADYDAELKRIVGVVESNNTNEIINGLSNYRKPRKPDVIFSTGHKAKGLEWDNVILANDFPVPLDDNGDYYELPQGEINLLYVCLTRAQKVLQTNRSIDVIVDERKRIDKNHIGDELTGELFAQIAKEQNIPHLTFNISDN